MSGLENGPFAGATVHYLNATLEEAIANPVPACGADLSTPPEDGTPMVGLSPITEMVTCEACLAVIKEQRTEGVGSAVTYVAQPHEGCDENSPCNFDTGVGIRAVTYDGEDYLHRDDVLRVIHALREAAHRGAHEAEDEEAQRSFTLVMRGMEIVGSTLFQQTQPGNAIDLAVPDSVEDVLAGWGSDTPAAESPIDAAIRKAKEAAQAAKENEESSQ